MQEVRLADLLVISGFKICEYLRQPRVTARLICCSLNGLAGIHFYSISEPACLFVLLQCLPDPKKSNFIVICTVRGTRALLPIASLSLAWSGHCLMHANEHFVLLPFMYILPCCFLLQHTFDLEGTASP